MSGRKIGHKDSLISFGDRVLNSVDIKLTIERPGDAKETCKGLFYFDGLLVYTFTANNVRSVAYEAQEKLNLLLNHVIDLRLTSQLIGRDVQYNKNLYTVIFSNPDLGVVHIIPKGTNEEEPEIIEIDFLSDQLVW